MSFEYLKSLVGFVLEATCVKTENKFVVCASNAQCIGMFY